MVGVKVSVRVAVSLYLKGSRRVSIGWLLRLRAHYQGLHGDPSKFQSSGLLGFRVKACCQDVF